MKITLNHNNNGFTLIEVIISMVIVSMITLIMAFSLKINLDAWERGNNEGDKVQVQIVLTNMLEKQLRYIVSSASLSNTDSLLQESSESDNNSNSSVFKQSGTENNLNQQLGTMTQLKFKGDEKSLSFYTLYSPQGTPSQGLIRIAYIYDEDKKELKIYEKVIGSQDDIEESDALFSTSQGKSVTKKSSSRSFKYSKSSKRYNSNSSGESMPVATVAEVEKFSLSFVGSKDSDTFKTGGYSGSNLSNSTSSSSFNKSSSKKSSDFKIDGSSFKDSWDEDSSNPPDFIKLIFVQAKRKGASSSVWLFKVGGTI